MSKTEFQENLTKDQVSALQNSVDCLQKALHEISVTTTCPKTKDLTYNTLTELRACEKLPPNRSTAFLLLEQLYTLKQYKTTHGKDDFYKKKSLRTWDIIRELMESRETISSVAAHESRG